MFFTLRQKWLGTVYSMIYVLYCVYSVYHFIKEKYVLAPVYTEVISTENIENVEKKFLKNDTGVVVFHPREGESYRKCMLVFNSCYGNANLKYLLVRQMQNTFSTFTIIQVEYPGFGFSHHFDPTITDILSLTFESYKLILEEYRMIETIGFFGEQFGSYVQSVVYEKAFQKNLRLPDFMIQLNGIDNLYDFAMEENHLFMSVLQLPLLAWKSSSEYYKNLKNNIQIFILFTNDHVSVEDSFSLYYQIYQPKRKVFLMELSGSKNFGFLVRENSRLIDNIYQAISKEEVNESSFARIVSNSPP